MDYDFYVIQQQKTIQYHVADAMYNVTHPDSHVITDKRTFPTDIYIYVYNAHTNIGVI